MIDRDLYLEAFQRAAAVSSSRAQLARGGQELIVLEIVGCLKGCKRVWLPFAYNTTLLRVLFGMGIGTWHDTENPKGEMWNVSAADVPDDVDAVYFGTPTILHNEPLFPETISDPQSWTKGAERRVVRHITHVAEEVKLKRIVCGLGSGDISLGERYYDVGPNAHAVAMKRFVESDGNQFVDFVITRELRA